MGSLVVLVAPWVVVMPVLALTLAHQARERARRLEADAASPRPWSERHRAAIGVALALLLAVLTAWAVRSLRSS